MSDVKVWAHQSTNERFVSVEHDRAHLDRPQVARVIIAQLLICALLFFILQPMGMTMSLSALLGGLCCAVPNAYFVRQAFRYQGARSAKLITRSFYRGEAGKLILTAVAFMLVFTLVKPLDSLALFSAYILVQTVNWFTPLLIKRSVRN